MVKEGAHSDSRVKRGAFGALKEAFGAQERLWYSREGQKILMQLQLADARLFFARPKIQRYMFVTGQKRPLMLFR